jgi:hypothetical protein
MQCFEFGYGKRIRIRPAYAILHTYEGGPLAWLLPAVICIIIIDTIIQTNYTKNAYICDTYEGGPHGSRQIDGIDGIICIMCIKDTYVVCVYVNVCYSSKDTI